MKSTFPNRSARYLNRELSWIEFNQRVLDEAFLRSHGLYRHSERRAFGFK